MITQIKSDIHFEVSASNHMVYGRLQEGKTAEMIAVGCHLKDKLKIPVVFIPQCFFVDFYQLCGALEEKLHTKPLHVPENAVTKPLEIGKITDIFKSCENNVLVCMGSEKRLSVLKAILMSLKQLTVKFAIIIDEVDVYFRNMNSKMAILIRWFLEHSTARVITSATLLDCTKVFHTCKIHLASPREGYRYTGIFELKHRDLDIVMDQDFESKIDIEKTIIKNLTWIDRNRPNDCLVLGFHSMSNDENSRICKKLCAKFPSWVFINYDQNGAHIHGETTELSVRTAISKAKLKSKKVYVCGGFMFNRSVNFVSDDFSYHPTDMIYTMNSSVSDAPLIAQRIGRLCGIDKHDKTTRMLHCVEKIYTIAKELVHGNEKFIELLVRTPNSVKTIEDRLVSVEIKPRETTAKLSKEQVERIFHENELVKDDIDRTKTLKEIPDHKLAEKEEDVCYRFPLEYSRNNEFNQGLCAIIKQNLKSGNLLNKWVNRRGIVTSSTGGMLKSIQGNRDNLDMCKETDIGFLWKQDGRSYFYRLNE